MRGSGLPLREPDAECETCSARGTVGRAIRTDADGMPLEIHRFCAACWPEQSARLGARWDEETRVAVEAWMRGAPDAPPPPASGTVLESATWHQPLAFVRLINSALKRGDNVDAGELTRIAREFETLAADRVGQMPLEVELFIRAHGAPAS